MKVKIVMMNPETERFSVEEFESPDVPAALEIRGYAIVGFESNPKRRAELQGQPMVDSLLGPMWDGDGIRYEDHASYEHLST